MYYHILPQTLLTLRDRFGWTQQKLAEEAGVERRTIIKKEMSDGPSATRDFVAERLANALGVEPVDLTKPIPEEIFRLDIDVFAHLRRTLAEKDHFYSQKILNYISYHFAEALDIAQVELTKDWQIKALEGPRPGLPAVPSGPIAINYGELDEPLLLEMMSEWHTTFGQELVNPDNILLYPKYSNIRSIVEKLPVVEKGRINSFWFKAYLRRASKKSVGGYTLYKISTFSSELWCVVSSPT